MKHIIKVNDIQDAKDNPTRPIIALDSNGILFAEGKSPVPEGFVDLGLPSGTFWSTKNIGATNGDTAESWYGDYYAWGEIETKANYSWGTYKYANGANNKLTKYCNDPAYGNEGYTDGLTQLVSEDDVATQTNSAWRMPTKEDFEELIAGTTNSWVTNYKGISGLNGKVFTSKVNGNTLFIPAAGSHSSSNIFNVGSHCILWSSSLHLNIRNNAFDLSLYSLGINLIYDSRYMGLSVRPIC